MRIEPLFDRFEIMEAEVRTLRSYSATAQADVLETACREFREAVADWLDEALTITEAAECPWWKDSTLAKKVRRGELPQAGEPGANWRRAPHEGRKEPPRSNDAAASGGDEGALRPAPARHLQWQAVGVRLSPR